MSKAIKVYAISPKKDYKAIKFFFKNLDVFKRYKEQILQNREAYTTRIEGMGLCGLFIGEYPACLGELMILYEDSWKFERDGDIRYLIHMAGSPLSGGNSCSFWSVKEQKIVLDCIERFSQAFYPLMEVKKEKPQFTLNDNEISKELEALLCTLADFYIDFHIDLIPVQSC